MCAPHIWSMEKHLCIIYSESKFISQHQLFCSIVKTASYLLSHALDFLPVTQKLVNCVSRMHMTHIKPSKWSWNHSLHSHVPLGVMGGNCGTVFPEEIFPSKFFWNMPLLIYLNPSSEFVVKGHVNSFLKQPFEFCVWSNASFGIQYLLYDFVSAKLPF